MSPVSPCPSPSEHDEQVSFFRSVFYTLLPDHPYLCLLHAIPNGARTSKSVAKRLKAEGMKAGVPDVFLPVPRGKYHGLYIEFKKLPYRNGKGKLVKSYPSPEQKRFISGLKDQGYHVVVAYGCDEGLAELKQYIGLGEFKALTDD